MLLRRIYWVTKINATLWWALAICSAYKFLHYLKNCSQKWQSSHCLKTFFWWRLQFSVLLTYMNVAGNREILISLHGHVQPSENGRKCSNQILLENHKRKRHRITCYWKYYPFFLFYVSLYQGVDGYACNSYGCTNSSLCGNFISCKESG